MSDRPTNSQLVEEFRQLLLPDFSPELLEQTKPWRAQLWQKFNIIADRVDPIGEEIKRRQRRKDNAQTS